MARRRRPREGGAKPRRRAGGGCGAPAARRRDPGEAASRSQRGGPRLGRECGREPPAVPDREPGPEGPVLPRLAVRGPATPEQ
ncbi:Hypothetical predicted protein [Marmota monax]|uniref:Uncharacterized protein n=1 Tax=Marmota monax TaxID=9995 RepID=A0A5E4A3U2_MARMO|nr:Hypothetical predicted protein [Marmota monax]